MPVVRRGKAVHEASQVCHVKSLGRIMSCSIFQPSLVSSLHYNMREEPSVSRA